MRFAEAAVKQYTENGYNCAEAIIHAGNEYYDLKLHEDDMKMVAGFGSGLYTGLTCGALCASISVLSMLYIKTKAHDHLDTLRPYSQKVVAAFNKKIGATQCAQVKPITPKKRSAWKRSVWLPNPWKKCLKSWDRNRLSALCKNRAKHKQNKPRKRK